MFITFTHEDDMRAAYNELREHGFTLPDTPGEVTRYLLRVTDADTPERSRIAKHLAREHGGVYEHQGREPRRSSTVPSRG